MMLQYFEDWFYLITLITALCAFMTWLVFARLSMARIEHAIKRDGLPRPCPWDGPGVRTLWYANAFVMSLGDKDVLIDAPLVRRYARPHDRLLGLVLITSAPTLALLGLVAPLLVDLS